VSRIICFTQLGHSKVLTFYHIVCWQKKSLVFLFCHKKYSFVFVEIIMNFIFIILLWFVDSENWLAIVCHQQQQIWYETSQTNQQLVVLPPLSFFYRCKKVLYPRKIRLRNFKYDIVLYGTVRQSTTVFIQGIPPIRSWAVELQKCKLWLFRRFTHEPN